jgi:hypothetical protein
MTRRIVGDLEPDGRRFIQPQPGRSHRARVPWARILAAAWVTALLAGCSSARESISYTPVREKFKTISREPRPLTDDEKSRVTILCMETAKEISAGVGAYARGAIKLARAWCGGISAVAGLLLALFCWWLAKRRIVGWRAFILSLLGAWGIAALAGWWTYQRVQLPLVRGLIASDWQLRELKQDGWIPGTTDPARVDSTTNCVDRIRDVAQGNDCCDRQAAAYPPLFKDLPPLPREPGGTNSMAYRKGLQSRAEDMINLLAVEASWQPGDRPIETAELFDRNPRFVQAVTDRYGDLAYQLFMRGVPAGVPAGPILIVLLVVLLVANSTLALATQRRKAALRRDLAPHHHRNPNPEEVPGV